jgi:hypothetical protein
VDTTVAPVTDSSGFPSNAPQVALAPETEIDALALNFAVNYGLYEEKAKVRVSNAFFGEIYPMNASRTTQPRLLFLFKILR